MTTACDPENINYTAYFDYIAGHGDVSNELPEPTREWGEKPAPDRTTLIALIRPLLRVVLG